MTQEQDEKGAYRFLAAQDEERWAQGEGGSGITASQDQVRVQIDSQKVFVLTDPAERLPKPISTITSSGSNPEILTG